MHGVDYYEMAVLGFTPALKHRPLMQSLKEPGPGSGYRRYIANDIAPSKIGLLPLAALTNADAAQWLNRLDWFRQDRREQAWLPSRCSQCGCAGPIYLRESL